MRTSLMVVAAAAFIATGCGDKAQVAGDKRKVDDKASTAAVTGTVGDWKSGDHAAWEAQLKSRAQNQNEYNRVATGPK
jgi:hypothetical protein